MAYPLLTERLSIAPLVASDLAAFVRYRRDPAVARFQGWSTDFGNEDAARLLAGQPSGALPAAGDWLQLGVRLRGSQPTELLGDVALHVLKARPDTVELGVTFAGEHQGHGFATEALGAVIGDLFVGHHVRRVLADCDARNDAVAALLGRVGLRREGRALEAEWLKGEWVTLDRHALLAREWRERNSAG